MNAANFPAPQPVALADALRWQASPDWTFETKLDGCRARLAGGELQGRVRRYPLPGEVPAALADCTLDGELVGNVYFAFDLLEADGQDLRRLPLRERQAVLLALQALFPDWIQPIPTARPGQSGSEYLQAVLRAGGEGCVAKHMAAPYGCQWFKAKRLTTFDVVVISPASFARSVNIGQYSDGALVDCGKVSVFNLGTLDNLRAGAVLEIAAQGRTVKGNFREPRFLKVRTDKPATACTI
jgi:bifunctional non-homologous end joining protein LigD